MGTDMFHLLQTHHLALLWEMFSIGVGTQFYHFHLPLMPLYSLRKTRVPLVMYLGASGAMQCARGFAEEALNSKEVSSTRASICEGD